MAHELILIIEDEEAIQELVRYNLEKNGFRTLCAGSGEEAIGIVRRESPSLILLDLMLPGIDGLEVCRRLKSENSTRNIPIVMLTAKGEESDIVAGLELGADDYITKPFSPRVLLARIKTVLRRVGETEKDDSEAIAIHNLTIHPGRHEVRVDGEPVKLTSTEFRVLHVLVRRPGWVMTRSRIAEEIHGADYPVTDRSVDVQIVALRRKLGEAGNYIETVRGVGYKFKE